MKKSRNSRGRAVVTISRTSRARGATSCKIAPCVVEVGWGGKVTFILEGECEELRVFIPTPTGAPKPFPKILHPHFKVPKKGMTVDVAKNTRRGRGWREYPFSVYCCTHNCFAEGSLPRMMIGP